MEQKISVDEARRQSIARFLGFMTAAELALLAGVKESTLEAWRKRNTGPDYVRLGNESLYPLDAVRAHLIGNKRNQGRSHVLDVL